MLVVSPQPKFIQLLRKLQDLGIVVVHQQFGNMLRDAEIKHKQLAEFAQPANQNTAIKIAAGLIDNLRGINNYSKKLAPSVRAFTDSTMAAYFYAKLPDAIGAIMALDAAKPKLVMVHNDVEPITMLMAMWARERGVPCLHIPHSVILDNADRGGPGTDIHDIVTASHIACSGPFQAEWYAARGADPKGLMMTGLPQFDRLAVRTHTRQEACRLLRLDPALPIVVYMSSWRQDTNILGCHDGVSMSLATFIDTMKAFPAMQTVIKTHPHGNNVDAHVQAAKQAGLRAMVTDQHLDIILSAADYVVSCGPSNTILEAAAFQRAHLICVAEPGSFPDDSEVVVIPSEVEALHATLTKLSTLPVPDYTNFIAKYLGPVDGGATARIETIARILHS